MEKIIDIRHLTKRYKNSTANAVDDISFYVKKGDLFALLGPNGAGKTTTVSVLTTTLQKTSGKIYIDGLDLDNKSTEIRKRIGIIFQNPSLDQNLTAEENVRLHTMLYGLYPFRLSYSMMPQSYQNKIQELSNILGIKKDIFKPIKTFSGGMKRKLEIIRSLMHQPKILFLDEPTTGLDPESRKNLWQYIRSVKDQEKTTIFLTTHYLEEAEMADYLFIINSGKLVSWGTPQKIKKDLVEEYLILDSKDRKKLVTELKHLKVSYSDTSPYKVLLDRLSAQQIIQAIKTPLIQLQIHTPTLEDAYLEIITSKEKNYANP